MIANAINSLDENKTKEQKTPISNRVEFNADFTNIFDFELFF